MRPGKRRRRTASSACALTLAIAVAVATPCAAAEKDRSQPPKKGASREVRNCAGKKISTAQGRVSLKGARRAILGITTQFMAANDIRATVLEVRAGNCTILSTGLGTSMAGVNANPRMSWRIGSIAVPLLTNLLMQLVDDHKVSLDAPLSKWLPGYPSADQVTLRMLASTTSGYPDYAQGNEAFDDTLDADVFKQWNQDELLAYAFARPIACAPATCFRYAHTNFILLGKVISAVTGRSVKRLIYRRVIRPLGLDHTRISDLPGMPSPALHSYSADRGPYEDATYWSPSWSIGPGVVMNSTVSDVVAEARAIGSGRLISRKARRAMFTNYAAGLPGISPTVGYGLGVLMTSSWTFQNPFINGYDGLMAFLPGREIAIGAVMTKGQAAAEAGNQLNRALFTQLGNYLAPEAAIPTAP
jgi:D-alanyl-D-alanine carboxypeptidase